jgi:ferric-dicitrate binding protein FerR (iron transport regulator)
MKDFLVRSGPSRRTFGQGLGLAVMAWPFASLLAADKAIGVVSEAQGEVAAELGNQRRELTNKSPIFLGDMLNTGISSRLHALLARKTSLRLGAETKVRIDQFIVDFGGELSLDNGALLLDAPSGKFTKGLLLQSPFALIAVRGTRFFAGDIDGTFGVFVVRGSVDVTAANVTVHLSRGEGTDIAHPGDPPGPVKKWGKPKIDKAMAKVR